MVIKNKIQLRELCVEISIKQKKHTHTQKGNKNRIKPQRSSLVVAVLLWATVSVFIYLFPPPLETATRRHSFYLYSYKRGNAYV